MISRICRTMASSYELADGELIVSLAPTYDHQRIVWQFSRVLMRAEDTGYGRG